MRFSPTIRAVFFDLDDTLCDTIGTREARARLAFEAVRASLPALSCDDFVARVMERRDARDVHGVPAVIQDLGLGDTKAGRAAIGVWFFDGCINLLRPFEDVAETVDRLRKDYTLGVITNGGGKPQRLKWLHLKLGAGKLQRLKWLHLKLGIDIVVISEECGFEKPDPRIFAHACSLARVSPPEAVFVGDRLDVDIAGAKAARMRAVWFNHWGGSLDRASPTPDAVIERFAELPAVLAGL